jgi:hypothetical protein
MRRRYPCGSQQTAVQLDAHILDRLRYSSLIKHKYKAAGFLHRYFHPRPSALITEFQQSQTSVLLLSA